MPVQKSHCCITLINAHISASSTLAYFGMRLDGVAAEGAQQGIQHMQNCSCSYFNFGILMEQSLQYMLHVES